MSKRVCAEGNCPVLIDAGTRDGRCDEHRRAKDKARGTRIERGYDSQHTALRRRWKTRVDLGGVRCARCGQPIQPGGAFDLDHDDHDRSRYLGPSHPACNRATAGRR